MWEATDQHGKSLRCLLCRGVQHRPIFHEFGVDILQCRPCPHVFSAYAAEAHYDGYWGEEVAEEDTFYWNEAHARMYQDFFRRFVVGRSGRLLDVGCGLGFFLQALKYHPNWEGYGCEISPAAARYARDTLGLTNVVCARLEDAALPERSFDLVTLWDVIEHLLEPDPVLRRCHLLLQEGGVCFMHTPNVSIQLPKAHLKKFLRGMQPGIGYLQARDHLHHYSMHSMRRLLQRNGFTRVHFVHLHPIQSVSGNKSRFLRDVKNVWFEVARALAMVSFGYLNLDNLFVVATKKSPTKTAKA